MIIQQAKRYCPDWSHSPLNGCRDLQRQIESTHSATAQFDKMRRGQDCWTHACPLVFPTWCGVKT